MLNFISNVLRIEVNMVTDRSMEHWSSPELGSLSLALSTPKSFSKAPSNQFRELAERLPKSPVLCVFGDGGINCYP